MTAIFAHRGCPGVPAPRENTIDAFLAAHRAGADGVELDARVTADGALAVHHDRHVPEAGDITNVSAAELPDHVPLLGDALDACRELQVNVEIKGGPAEADLVGRLLLERGTGGAGVAPGVFVSSFLPESLAAFRELAPAIPAGLLTDWRTDARAAVDAAVTLGCATLHPFVTQVDDGLVEAARRAALGLHVWSVNAEDDLFAMGALGVEAVITDRVEAAVRVLRTGSAVGEAGGGRQRRSRRR